MSGPVLRQCRGPGCRAWFSVELEICPWCDAKVKWMRAWAWMDRIVVVVSLVALAGLAYMALA